MFKNIKKIVLIKLLKAVERDTPLGTELFNAIARLSFSVCFEAVLFRKNNNDQIEVFLAKRQPNQTYANQWHIPGSVFRPLEREVDVANRLSQVEYGANIYKYQYCEDFFYEAAHGTILDRIYLVEIKGDIDSRFGKWFGVDSLPDVICDFHQEKVIPIALQCFNKK